MTTATVKKPQEPGQSPIYQLTVTVHRADGSGVPAHDVEFKYARRRDSDPERVLFDLNPVKDGISYSIQTGDDGTATIEVASMRADHLPALDVRAAFMPANQRFHVNLMLNQQVLAPPAPPSLVVQSKLIQDYTHSSGGAINEDRDRSTWRTVIRAVNSDGSLRSGEPISLWAEAQLDLEVGNRSYRVNRENSAELLTDDTGELVIVFDADALSETR